MMNIIIKDRGKWLTTVATALDVPVIEGQNTIEFNNEIGEGSLFYKVIEEGIIIRSINFNLKQDVSFKEEPRKKSTSLIIDFSFQGYPKGTVFLEQPQLTIEQGKQVLMYTDNSTIIGRFNKQVPRSFMSIEVKFEWLKRNFKDFFESYPEFNEGLYSGRVHLSTLPYGLSHQESLEQLMFKEYAPEIIKPVYKGLVLIIVSDILIQFISNTDQQRKHSFSLETQKELDELDAYIRLNLDKEISVEDLCKKIGYSKTKLHGLFKDYFKYSMYDYIKHMRLKKSQSLLITTELPIAEIAIRVGYQSIPHFTNLFKKEIGTTPTEYRKGYNRDIFH
ncbi:helix-turn-helix domain-containing protein [Flammeovirga kamogawensis]|uniref:Helix-turn-helix transcriptional regulator n=1 Tax=Flammeovirga kamogawensis TaxID=373891 RepID=A0ABX8GSD2_9BACT|nr:AraC family transcriptional regulator [Flammeovirga kamogawensis]MBB6462136.1 AraC-like DNA-binding protein [Flammeovirga kamogawensis]QWG05870.1 helix-turn-helix transcriptional regulator [Flammeovirga kamogawensis]TRX67694.1 helix-turn-helix transcriptional regulator [Flammeovirga kamogawensis]